jgi:hypothetical protein
VSEPREQVTFENITRCVVPLLFPGRTRPPAGS